jgi:hypothetical protein
MKEDLNSAKKLRIETPKILEETLFSPIDVTPEPSVFSPPHQGRSLKRYDDLSREFYKEGVNYSRQSLLRGISHEWQSKTHVSFQEAFQMLTSVANALLLTNLELVYWSFILNKNLDSVPDCHFLVFFTAYLTKCHLNSDPFPFEAYLNTVLPNFKHRFSNWQLVSDFTFEFTIKEVNSRYNKLIANANSLGKNYNSMVDLLMQIPRRKASVMSESLISEASFDTIDVFKPLEGFERDLLEDAKNSPIDRLGD